MASSGNIVVADTGNNRVVVFDSLGNFRSQLGTSGPGQLNQPGGLAMASNGNIVVADTGNSRVVVFDSLGNFRSQFGSEGTGPGQFQHVNAGDGPRGVAIAANGNIVVCDFGGSRVEVFNSYGNFLSAFGTFGRGPGQFIFPWGVVIAPNGDFLVTN